MTKVIVTTSINPPTEATKAFARMKGWQLIVVGDLKTPHDLYEEVDCIYLDPDQQRDKYPEISRAIGWNKIQRRNIGFIEAYNMGADIVATVDDDNIPYEDWGTDLYVGRETEVDLYEPKEDVFDPLSVTESNHVWHRGYPIQYIPYRKSVKLVGRTKRRVLVQADLWDGDPDIDAIARIVHPSPVKFDDVKSPFCSTCVSPFGSQNTFLAREVIPFYAVYPFVGRMDDIWGGYFLQCLFPQSLIYNRASVYHRRNPHDTIANLENETLGYRKTLQLIKFWQEQPNTLDRSPVGVPVETLEFYKVYREHFSA